MSATVFHRIVAGELPCHRLYEDQEVLAFLDLYPLSRGHTLVVPKQAAVTLDQLSEVHAAAIGRVLPRLCRALLKATGAQAFNVLQNNGAEAHQAIPYVHFHIIPKYRDGTGLGIGWKPQTLAAEEGRALAREVAAGL